MDGNSSESDLQSIRFTIPGSWIFATATLLINFSLWAALFYLGQYSQSYNGAGPATPVRVISEKEWEAIHRMSYVKGERKIVQSDELPESQQAEADPFPAEFLGQKTQRVKKETLSRGEDPMGGMVGSETARPTNSREMVEKLFASGEALKLSTGPGAMQYPAAKENIEPAKPASRPNKRLSMDDLGKNVEMGAATLLNTDEYRFYGFVNRIKEGVYPLWRRNLTYYSSQTRVQAGQFVIRGTVVMKPDGSYLKIEDWVPCGVSAFDRSVEEAFRDLPRVPNPPSEMVDPDGLVRLRFSFRVDNDSSNVVVDYRRSGDDLPRGAR